MKGFIVGLVLLSSFTVVAAEKNMISFDVGDIVNQEGNFNTNLTSNSFSKHNDEEGSSNSLLINYAREVIPHLQVRVLLGYSTAEELFDTTDDLWEETKKTTYGLGLIYNFQEELSTSWYIGATYIMQNVDYLKEANPATNDVDESGSASTLLIEVGKRFKIGNLAGMNFA